MVLPVLRDKYAENLQAARAEGVEIGEARGEVRGEVRGREIGEARGREIGMEIGATLAKRWYERKQLAEENGEPFNEPPPWEK